ncbi:MAG: TraR/DksA family transcriptional regulator [Desulfuromonadales bacterium]|nr:TraR/DksA family transcriptional regulator [Desulfuromonadales bacterium]NIR33158.1 TraR/DksA family transcriptional regulator [Desulfuromonadales bacterium]NIS41942.1 TraR/DksA family transcriptional regulator [Desulfuromonadales bacterium]
MNELQDDQIEELREDLLALREQLEKLLQSTQESSRPVDLNEPIGRVTRIDAIQQQSMAQAGRRAQELQLSRVKAALAAMASGDYGLCRRCEEPIAYTRLKVSPESPFCVDCQGNIEKLK